LKVLGIDTSCAASSVCVIDASEDGFLALAAETADENRAEALAPMVERVVTQTGGMRTLERIAVTVGPGSFTGIRIGLSLAKAMGLVLQIPVIGVPTLAAFASTAFADGPGSLIASVIDARHGTVYFELFDSYGVSRGPARPVKLVEAVRAIGAGPVRIAGDAAEALFLEAKRYGLVVESIVSGLSPDAFEVAKLGARLDPLTSPARPLYVKAPDVRPPASLE
jgi:tRNA threonylcarbamoyl adenosine modification protein YeaZ